MKKILLFTTVIMLISFQCSNTSNENNSEEVFLAQKSINKLILQSHKNKVKFSAKATGHLFNYTLNKYKEDALKSFKINDSIPIENTDIFSVFYSYNLGTDIHREHVFIKKIDGYYVVSENQYYNKYEDNPFKNGKSEDAKKMLDKIDEWETK